MSCCTSIRNLGCFNSCEDISTGLTATSTGTWAIKVDFTKIVEFDITSGEEIEIPGGYFNEDVKTVFQIIKPDNTVFEYEDFDCFYVIINPSLSQVSQDTKIEYGSNIFVT